MLSPSVRPSWQVEVEDSEASGGDKGKYNEPCFNCKTA